MENIKFLKPYMKKIISVLEPSCGSGEYIQQLLTHCDSIETITGVELNKTIFEGIKHMKHEKLSLHNEDYLQMNFEQKYDLVIGNPPYFVMKKKEVDHSYYDYFDGRPNIFILFIIKSLGLLNDKGILSFILPRNFLNCLYYDKTRKYINENFKILNIMECHDDYIDTQQDTIILIVKKRKMILVLIIKIQHRFSSFTIFGMPKSITKLKSYMKIYYVVTLANVNVGNVVWNQCKTQLCDDPIKTLLVYSSDIETINLL